MSSSLVWRSALAAVLSAAAFSCSPPQRLCVPGETSTCSGPGLCIGTQACNSAGNGYGVCSCGGFGGGIAAGGGAGGGAAGGGSGGGVTGGGGGGVTGGGTGGGVTGGGTGGGTVTGGGTGGGTVTGGGTGGGVTGGGTGGGGGGVIATTIAAAKASVFPAKVNLQGVVVTAVSFGRASNASTFCSGTSTRGINASFWVADPNNPQIGVWAEKFRCDRDPDYLPQVGDVLDLSGIIGFESMFVQQEGYRTMVKSEFDFIPSKPIGYVCELTSSPPCEPFVVTKIGVMVPLPVVNVPSSFGGGGAIRAEPAHVGARVKIAGPLTLTNPNPEAMHRNSAFVNDTRYFGFQLSNGVLVNNFRIFEGATLEDGGVSHCDARYVVLDGGTFSFPNGIVGVWDTYTHASCTDGGINLTACFNNAGTVPGTDAGFTHVLYPTDCADQTP